MPKRVYVGPHDEVDLPAASAIVRRGEAVEVSAELAAQLDEQPENWADPRTSAAKTATTPPSPPAPDATTLDGQQIEETHR
jgi:hypothetical protein